MVWRKLHPGGVYPGALLQSPKLLVMIRQEFTMVEQIGTIIELVCRVLPP